MLPPESLCLSKKFSYSQKVSGRNCPKHCEPALTLAGQDWQSLQSRSNPCQNRSATEAKRVKHWFAVPILWFHFLRLYMCRAALSSSFAHTPISEFPSNAAYGQILNHRYFKIWSRVARTDVSKKQIFKLQPGDFKRHPTFQHGWKKKHDPEVKER